MFAFAASRSYDYRYHVALRNRRPILSSHTKSKMPSVSLCKSDVLLSPFPDALMLRHLLHWNSQSIIKANAERLRVGASSYQEIGARGWGCNFMGGPKFMTPGPEGPFEGARITQTTVCFRNGAGGGYKSRYTTKLLKRRYCKLVFTTRRSVSVHTEKITSQNSNHDDICAVAINGASLVDAHPVRNLSSRYSKSHESTTLLIALIVGI